MARGSCKKVMATTEFLIISTAPSRGELNNVRPTTSIKIINAIHRTQNAETTWMASARRLTREFLMINPPNSHSQMFVWTPPFIPYYVHWRKEFPVQSWRKIDAIIDSMGFVQLTVFSLFFCILRIYGQIDAVANAHSMLAWCIDFFVVSAAKVGQLWYSVVSEQGHPIVCLLRHRRLARGRSSTYLSRYGLYWGVKQMEGFLIDVQTVLHQLIQTYQPIFGLFHEKYQHGVLSSVPPHFGS